jgi:hypothetical protein
MDQDRNHHYDVFKFKLPIHLHLHIQWFRLLQESQKPWLNLLWSLSPTAQKRWNCKQLCLITVLFLKKSYSTITYDTLVRAGVSVVSAFVAEQPDSSFPAKQNSPPLAKGSRGINILPDTYFEPSSSGPVRLP